MREIPREDVLDVIGCEIGRRPEAPGIGDLVPQFIGLSREEGALTVRFAGDTLAALEAFAEAERQCCAGLGWSVRGGPEAILRIEAEAEALDALTMMFESARIENTR